MFHFDRGEGRYHDFQKNVDTIELDNFTFAAGETAAILPLKSAMM